MGLDGVEIVMDVEDHFGITFQDAEAEQIRTVADIVSIIASRIQNARDARCPTLASFMRIRTCVRKLTGNNELKIRTQTRVVDVLNSAQRKIFWKSLGDILGSPAPPLRRPPRLRTILLYSVLLAFILAVVIAIYADLATLPFNIAIAITFTLFLHRATAPYRTHPPDAISTFGSISSKVSGLTVATKRLELRTDAEILAELKPIISDVVNVPTHQIQPCSRFVEDLGVG